MAKRVDLEILKIKWAEPENWGKSLKAMCEQLGYTYSTVAKKITVYGTEKFYEERNQLIKSNLKKAKDIAYKTLIEKAREGNLKAVEMILKMTGDLTEKVEITGKVNITIFTKRKFIDRENKDNE